MHVAFILCDAAQASPDGKVHILGAGWRICGPVVAGHAVVSIITLSGEEFGDHALKLELVDEDGRPVTLATPGGPMAVRSEGQLSVQRPPDLDIGQEVDCSFVAQIGPGLPLNPGGTYVWQLWIDDETRDEWRHPFYVRSAE